MDYNVEKEVKEMLASMTGFEPEEIELEKRIIQDLGVDSLKIIEIATAIEKKYKVRIKESQMVKIKTVQDAVNIIKELLEK